MQEQFKLYRRKVEEYSNDQLKNLVKRAWDAEMKQREEKLGRPLSVEEKGEVKISEKFLQYWHQKGLVPTPSTFLNRFGSYFHLAELLGLSSTYTRPQERYFEGEKDRYIALIKSYVEEFKKQNERNPNRKELRLAINYGKIPGVPTTLLNHSDIFNILDIEAHTTYNTEHSFTFSEAEIVKAVQDVFQEKCKQEAEKLGKDSLSSDERKKVRLTMRDYEFFRKEKKIKGPRLETLIKRIGPSWSDVLNKADLF